MCTKQKVTNQGEISQYHDWLLCLCRNMFYSLTEFICIQEKKFKKSENYSQMAQLKNTYINIFQNKKSEEVKFFLGNIQRLHQYHHRDYNLQIQIIILRNWLLILISQSSYTLKMLTSFSRGSLLVQWYEQHQWYLKLSDTIHCQNTTSIFLCSLGFYTIFIGIPTSGHGYSSLRNGEGKQLFTITDVSKYTIEGNSYQTDNKANS